MTWSPTAVTSMSFAGVSVVGSAVTLTLANARSGVSGPSSPRIGRSDAAVAGQQVRADAEDGDEHDAAHDHAAPGDLLSLRRAGVRS